jgi:hypothetical protein
MPDELGIPQAVDYGQMAKQMAAGVDEAGGFDKYASATAKAVSGGMGSMLTGLVGGVDKLVGLLLKGIFKLVGNADPLFGELGSMIVGNMFEVDVDESAFTNIRDNGGRKAIARAVGDNLLAAFKGDQADVGPGELQPSTEGAAAYLGVMANLAIEGWVYDVLGGLIPIVHLERLGELNEMMASVLGLGRMSRAVLRPFVNTLIATPAQWAVNKQYRPKMLSVSEAIHVWRRGAIDEATVDEIAARDGLGDDALAALKATPWSPLSPADARLLQLAGVWQDAEVVDELRVSEGTDDRIALARQLEDVKALHTFELKMVDAAANAYADRKIDEPTLTGLLSGTTLDSTTLARIHELASQRRLVNVLHLSRGDVEKAVKLKVLSVSDYSDWLIARGYAQNDALTLELMLQAELQSLDDAAHLKAAAAADRAAAKAARAQAAQFKRDQIAAEHAHWTGTLSQAERLVVRNILPALTYQQILVDHGVAPADAAELVTVATQDRDARAALLAKQAATKGATKLPTVPLATLVHAILLGARSIDALAPAMHDLGYSADDVALETDLVRQELADRAAAAATRAAKAPAGSARALTLAQLERAVLNGVATTDRYQAALVAAGFGPTDVALLVADLEARLEARRFADERRALAEEKFAASHLSLATLEKAVVDGVQTLTDYQAELAARGLDQNDQAILVALLKIKLGTA